MAKVVVLMYILPQQKYEKKESPLSRLLFEDTGGLAAPQ